MLPTKESRRNEMKMKMKNDRRLLRHALAQGIRTAAEMAAWLRALDGRKATALGALAQA
jgi:hypothetical protein